MLKNYFFVLFLIFSAASYSQMITVSNIVRTGNFANCSGGNPTVTAEMITSDGSIVVNGDLQIIDPCGFTTVRVVMANLRYDQPGANWPHGFFFPEGENITVANVSLPYGWIPMASVTGASCSAQETGGAGFYFDNSAGSSCGECNPTMMDGIPSNNYGQSSMNCSTPFSIGFDMTFCNSKVLTETTTFTLKGTSDGNTGCWSIVDTLTNTVSFSINTIESTVPLYTDFPENTEVITECINGGSEYNYIAVLEASCGSGDDVTWWSSASGGAMIGTGSPFYYDPPGQACPQGMIFYASCCPAGEGCERQPVIVGQCQPPSETPTFAPIPPQCPGLPSPLPNVSLEGATGTWTPAFDPFNTATYTFTPDPGQCVTQAISIEVVIMPEIDLVIEPLEPICEGSDPPDLPTPEPFVNGTWSPAVIDTSTPGTYTYTFTPEEGVCAEPVTIEIIIEDKAIPEFTIDDHYCQGTEIIVLPTVSDNGTPGTWVPAQVDTSVVGVVTYTFTPSGTDCFDIFSIDITVEETIIPTFPALPEICQNSTPPDLPASNEGLTGTWSPAVIDTTTAGTFDFVFTPDAECSEAVTIQVIISPAILAQFNIDNSYCQFETAQALPLSSDNGVTGVWFPASIDTNTPGTFTYTFTPDTGQCSEEFQLIIEVYEQPVLNTVAPQILCDEDFDGVYHVNLNDMNPLLGGGTGISYTYYASMADYNNNNPIPAGQVNDYQITVLPATVYATGTSGQSCVSDVVGITFNAGEVVNHNNGPFGPIEFCDGANVDLTQFEAQISTAPGVVFEYYNTESNARLGLSEILNPADFTPGMGQTTAFVRIEAPGFCSAIVQIDLIRNPVPSINAPDVATLCSGDEIEATAMSNDPTAVFQWTLPNGDIFMGQTVIITELGNYSVIAISAEGCESQPRILVVSPPSTPVFTLIEVSGTTIIVGATNGGDGTLEYSLDGIFWQTSNQFPNLIPGETYTVWIRSGGCITAKTTVTVLFVPNFISPNDDGINDVWTIRGIQSYPGATLKIFDRYGKIFVDTTFDGNYIWNGKYSGRNVASADYWYIIHVPASEFMHEQKFVGHITVRNQ